MSAGDQGGVDWPTESLNSLIDPQLLLLPSGTGQSSEHGSLLNQHQSTLLSGVVDPQQLQTQSQLFDSWNGFEDSALPSDEQFDTLFDTRPRVSSAEKDSGENNNGFSGQGHTTEHEMNETNVNTDVVETPETDEQELTNQAYARLLYRCLASTSPENQMILRDIYAWFKTNTLRGRTSENPKAWKNSIRHNLSMNKGFNNWSRTDPTGSKKYMWSLSDEVIQAGSIEPTTRFRKEDKKVKKTPRQRVLSGAISKKQSSGSKGGRATRQGTRKNPPRMIARQQIDLQPSSSPSVAPVSVYSSPVSSPSPYYSNMNAQSSTPYLNLQSSMVTAPGASYLQLPPKSSYPSSQMQQSLMAPPTSTSSFNTGPPTSASPFNTVPPVQGALTGYDPPMFTNAQSPFMGYSPTSSYGSHYQSQSALTVFDETDPSTLGQSHFSANGYLDLSDPQNLLPPSGYHTFDGTFDINGTTWSSGFGSMI